MTPREAQLAKDDHALVTDTIAYLFSVGRDDAAHAIHSLLRDAEVVRDFKAPHGTPLRIRVCWINGLPHITEVARCREAQLAEALRTYGQHKEGCDVIIRRMT